MIIVSMILSTYSSPLEAFIGGFCSFLLLVAIYYLARFSIKSKKRLDPKIKTITDEINQDIKWKNSQEYHIELLRLMEEGHSKRMAKNILAERRKIEKIERKSSLSGTIYYGESNIHNSKQNESAPQVTKGNNNVERENVATNNNIVEECDNGVDPESEFLGNVITKFNELGKEGAINYLVEHGYSRDSALEYLSDYMILRN